GFEILEHLLRLCLHVAGADDGAVLVEGNLSGDIDGLHRSGHFDDMRVAGRLGERGRVGALHVRHASLSGREDWSEHDEQRDDRSHYRLFPLPRPLDLPVPPLRPFAGGAGRYSIMTLLTSAMGRSACVYVRESNMFESSSRSTVSFSPRTLTASSASGTVMVTDSLPVGATALTPPPAPPPTRSTRSPAVRNSFCTTARLINVLSSASTPIVAVYRASARFALTCSSDSTCRLWR